MKKIYVNFKRFDIPKEYGGVNSLYPIDLWAGNIIKDLDGVLEGYEDTEFTFLFPESHLLKALEEKPSHIKIGSQGVYRKDVAKGGNFGAFTTFFPPAAASAMGAKATLIGHCEERNNYKELIKKARGDEKVLHEFLNESVKGALARGLDVLFAIGESADEQANWKEVLKEQIDLGLKDVDRSKVTLAYEPVWAIGPGKTPPDKAYIEKIADFIKEETGGLDLVYGGGLKADNAKMLASIDNIDGGLIALTRFSGDIGFYPEEFLEIVNIYRGV
ncbi:MAG: triose-phosphate isomerase family protein [Anaerococcus sp.]|nr:triose-phosphate isomerase family protein [Anaerococcus sp.]